MNRCWMACGALAFCYFFTLQAEARPPTARVVGTPLIAPTLPLVMLVRPIRPRLALAPGPDAALAWVTRNIEGQRSHALLRSSDDRSREGMLRELAMTVREDTSLGVRSARLSIWGTGMSGFGLCGMLALSRGDTHKRWPVSVGVAGFPGGGGISLSRDF